jgi:8-oxo-dGTP diphosphatase
MAERPGASIAVLTRNKVGNIYVAAIQRDDDPAIAYPGRWELPGGTLEPDETPEEGARRECGEEINVVVNPDEILGNDEDLIEEAVNTTLVVAMVAFTRANAMKLGDEGQACKLIKLNDFLDDSLVIPEHRMRLRRYVVAMGQSALIECMPILVSATKEE